MLLAIDVGNTNTVMGIFQGGDLLTSWRISTDRHKTADEFGILICSLLDSGAFYHRRMQRIIISSVVPSVVMVLEEMADRYFHSKPLVVSNRIQSGIRVLLDHPEELGADRLVNAVAAYHYVGGPVIVVDFGTATTFCCISREGEYLGGAIAPGIEISCGALFKIAAKLPRVEIVGPDQVMGKNTVQALQSGIIFGFAGQVDGLVERLQAGFTHQARVIATGGQARLIYRHTRSIDLLDPYLTLKGLYLLGEMNREEEPSLEQAQPKKGR